MKWLKAAAATLFARDKSLMVGGWKYDYVPIKGGQIVTITPPGRESLRPVMVPRGGYNWFTNG